MILLGVIQNSKWVMENVLRTLTCEPHNPPTIDNVHTQNSHFYLPYVLTICSISPLSVCNVGNPFKRSFQIV